MGNGMMIGIMTRFSLLKSQVTWRVIKIFAGCRWLKFIHQTAVRIVRYFLNHSWLATPSGRLDTTFTTKVSTAPLADLAVMVAVP